MYLYFSSRTLPPLKLKCRAGIHAQFLWTERPAFFHSIGQLNHTKNVTFSHPNILSGKKTKIVIKRMIFCRVVSLWMPLSKSAPNVLFFSHLARLRSGHLPCRWREFRLNWRWMTQCVISLKRYCLTPHLQLSFCEQQRLTVSLCHSHYQTHASAHIGPNLLHIAVVIHWGWILSLLGY